MDEEFESTIVEEDDDIRELMADEPPPLKEDNDELKCDVCGRADFKNLGGLRRHITVAHGGSASYKTDAVPKSGRAPKASPLEPDLIQFFVTIAMVTSMVNATDGMIIAQNAEALGKAWAHLASTNKAVEKVLRQIMTGSAVAEVMAATLTTAIPILANHGVLPPQMLTMFASAPVPPSAEGMGNDAD